MKKKYISPNIEVVEIGYVGNLLTGLGSGEADGDAYAPAMLNDDELFQMFLIHQEGHTDTKKGTALSAVSPFDFIVG